MNGIRELELNGPCVRVDRAGPRHHHLVINPPNLIRLPAQLREEHQNPSSGSLRISFPLQATSVQVSQQPVSMIREGEGLYFAQDTSAR
jgi:hypothetical protein